MSFFTSIKDLTVGYGTIAILFALVSGFENLGFAEDKPTMPSCATYSTDPITAQQASTFGAPGATSMFQVCQILELKALQQPLPQDPTVGLCQKAVDALTAADAKLPSQDKEKLSSIRDCRATDTTTLDDYLSSNKPPSESDCQDSFGEDSDFAKCKAVNGGASADSKDSKATAAEKVTSLKADLADLQKQLTEAKTTYTKAQTQNQSDVTKENTSYQQSIDSQQAQLPKELAKVDASTQDANQQAQTAALKLQQQKNLLEDKINRDVIAVNAAKDNMIVICVTEAAAKTKADLDAFDVNNGLTKSVTNGTPKNYNPANLTGSQKSIQRRRLQLMSEDPANYQQQCLSGNNSPAGAAAQAAVNAAAATLVADQIEEQKEAALLAAQQQQLAAALQQSASAAQTSKSQIQQQATMDANHLAQNHQQALTDLTTALRNAQTDYNSTVQDLNTRIQNKQDELNKAMTESTLAEAVDKCSAIAGGKISQSKADKMTNDLSNVGAFDTQCKNAHAACDTQCKNAHAACDTDPAGATDAVRSLFITLRGEIGSYPCDSSKSSNSKSAPAPTKTTN